MSGVACRVCMIQQEKMIDIFQYNMGNDIAHAFLMRFCDVKIIEGDGLPSKICIKCLRCLKSAYKFKRQCEQTDIILRQKTLKLSCRDATEESSKTDMNKLENSNDLIISNKKLDPQNSCDAYYSPNTNHNNELVSTQIKVDNNSDNIFFIQQDRKTDKITGNIIKKPVIKKIKERKNATCPVCYQKFESYEDYRVHVRKHNEDIEKPYKCKVCGKGYLCASRLNRHLFTHTDVKLFECSICKKGFNNSAHMKSHMFVHTGEKPYVCDMCNKSFNQMPHLKRHMQSHTKI